MKSRVKTIIQYKFDQEKELLGVDGKYHYFYKVVNLINGNFYFGIHSTKSLSDNYCGSGTLIKQAYKKYGYEAFEMYIIRFFESRQALSDYEEFVVCQNLVENNQCYNLIKGGNNSYPGSSDNKHSTLGRVHINNGMMNKCVYPDEIDSYLCSGWKMGELQQSTKGKVVVHKDGCPDRFIYQDELAEYIDDGWQIGGCSRNKGMKSFAAGTIWISKGNQRKRIILTELESYIKNGWRKGSNQSTTKGYIRITDGVYDKNVTQDQLQQYLDTGWKIGSSSKTSSGFVWVTRQNKCKMIPISDILEYENNGWTRGRKISKT